MRFDVLLNPLFVCVSVCLSVCLSVSASVRLSLSLSRSLPACLPVYLCLSVCLITQWLTYSVETNDGGKVFDAFDVIIDQFVFLHVCTGTTERPSPLGTG